MKLIWAELAWADYVYWQAEQFSHVSKINALIKDIQRHPYNGLGKPEPLKGSLQGWWSRRITGEHRLVYRVSGKAEHQAIEIAQCRMHY